MSSRPVPSKIITELPSVVGEPIAAVNAFDTERIVETFAADAYVNDNRRESWGPDAIAKFMAREFVGDLVTMEVREIVDNDGDIIVRARYDGTCDKTNLPDELMMSGYFSIRDGKIVSLTIIRNQPSPYKASGKELQSRIGLTPTPAPARPAPASAAARRPRSATAAPRRCACRSPRTRQPRR